MANDPKRAKTASPEADEFDLLVESCVAAYEKTLNDTLALDYNQVLGKMRSMVLDNETYKKRTRSIRARRFMEEAEELDNLFNLAKKADGVDEDDPESCDPRAGSGKKTDKKATKSSVDKDEINMRFKVSQERRQFLRLDNNSDNDGESEALNFFFVPLDREEFERLSVAEVSDGVGGGGDAFSVESESSEEKLKALLAETQRPDDDGLAYFTNSDGDIEEG
jgi:hypothetical protein